MKQSNKQQGFTLIELMIVIVILGIIAAVAIPNYLTYVNRSKVSEGLLMADAAKTAVAETAMNSSSGLAAASSNTAVGLPATVAGTYVSNITVGAVDGNNGVVTVTFNSQVPALTGSAKIYLVPSYTAGSNNPITWSCQYSSVTIDPSYVPASCRTNSMS